MLHSPQQRGQHCRMRPPMKRDAAQFPTNKQIPRTSQPCPWHGVDSCLGAPARTVAMILCSLYPFACFASLHGSIDYYRSVGAHIRTSLPVDWYRRPWFLQLPLSFASFVQTTMAPAPFQSATQGLPCSLLYE